MNLRFGRFHFAFSIVVALVVTAYSIAFYASAGFARIGGGGGSWAATYLDEKLAILSSTQRPRIAIVAGSNGLFGLSAEQMSQALVRPVVNVAMHGGLSWRLYEHFVLPALEPGDDVILPLEVDFFFRDQKINDLTAETAHSFGLEYFRSLSATERLSYLRSLSLPFLFNQILAKYVTPAEPRLDGYWAFKVSEFGDLAFPANAESQPDKVSAADSKRSKWPTIGRNAEAVCNSIRTLRSRGIRAFVTPPNRFVGDDGVPGYDRMLRKIANLVRQCGAQYVDAPNGGRQPLERMFDTVYHLTADGRRDRTQEFIVAFCAVYDGCIPTAGQGIDRMPMSR